MKFEFTVDKRFTCVSLWERRKEVIKEFDERYTPSDLLNLYSDAFGQLPTITPITAKVEIFGDCDTVHYRIEILGEYISTILYSVKFYMDDDEIAMPDMLHDCKKFVAQND